MNVPTNIEDILRRDIAEEKGIRLVDVTDDDIRILLIKMVRALALTDNLYYKYGK